MLYVVTGVRTQVADLSPVQSRLLDYFSAADDDAQRAALLVLEALARLEPGNRQPQPPAPPSPQRNWEVRPDIDQAISALANAESAVDLARGVSVFTEALGLERYTVIAFRGHVAAQLFHNSPPGIEEKLPELEAFKHDPVVARAMASHIPVVWQSGSGGDWRELLADFGYRCGIASAALDGSGTGCVLAVSSSHEKLPEAYLSTLLGYTLMAAVTLSSDPLRKLAAAQEAVSPSTRNRKRRLG